MEIGNLTILNGEKAWKIMEQENLIFLNESWNTTADKIALEGEDTYFNKLPLNLQNWITEQIDTESDIFLSIQGVGTSITNLKLLLERELGFKFTLQEIGLAWHLLHAEQ